MNKQIEKQSEFVEFLKDKGLYDPNNSAATMVKMMAVWKACGEGKL